MPSFPTGGPPGGFPSGPPQGFPSGGVPSGPPQGFPSDFPNAPSANAPDLARGAVPETGRGQPFGGSGAAPQQALGDRGAGSRDNAPGQSLAGRQLPDGMRGGGSAKEPTGLRETPSAEGAASAFNRRSGYGPGDYANGGSEFTRGYSGIGERGSYGNSSSRGFTGEVQSYRDGKRAGVAGYGYGDYGGGAVAGYRNGNNGAGIAGVTDGDGSGAVVAGYKDGRNAGGAVLYRDPNGNTHVATAGASAGGNRYGRYSGSGGETYSGYYYARYYDRDYYYDRSNNYYYYYGSGQRRCRVSAVVRVR
jgi:hypothetical protein